MWMMSTLKFIKILAVLVCGALIAADAGIVYGPVSPVCTYETYNWNVAIKRAVDYRLVRKPYRALSPEEVDAMTGCSVCREDQKLIDIAPLAPFYVCHKIAPRLNTTLQGLLDKGAPIFHITGYRVGRTRGDVDHAGNRTGFSNHSFGLAIDINSDRNGLYESCLVFGPDCHLIRGGAWHPELPGSLTAEGMIVRALKAAGFQWGGEIAGQQKDFMHFSPTGY